MWTGVLTMAGLDLLSQWAAGGTLQILGASAGSGTIDAAALMAATTLANEVEEVSIVACKKLENAVQYDVQFVAVDEEYTAQQIGIWARLNDGARTLMAIYQDSENGIAVQSKANMPGFIFGFQALVQMGSTGDLTVNIDTGALVSRADLDEALQNIKIDVDDEVIAGSENPVSGGAVHAYVAEHVPDTVPADSITAGTFAGMVKANPTATADLLTPQVRNSVATSTDPGVGVQVDYPIGTEINVYEPAE